jgi:hypothetical protein
MGNLIVKRSESNQLLSVKLPSPVLSNTYLTLRKEAENMLYLEKNTQVRTPKLYAAYKRILGTEDNGEIVSVNCLIMEDAEGRDMSLKRYEALDNEAQELFVSRLAEQYRFLRSVPSEGYYGRVYKQPFDGTNALFRTNYIDSAGPYSSFEEVFQAMYTSVQIHCAAQPQDEFQPTQITFLERFNEIIRHTKGTKPVLTLIDCQFQNIIAKEIKDSAGKIVDWKITMIDVDMLGWLPAFVQFYCAKYLLTGDHETGKTFNRRLIADIAEEDYLAEVDFLYHGQNRSWFRVV